MDYNMKKTKLHTLFTPWGENIRKDCPLNEYPRPQLQRDNWFCLNGFWQYAICEDQAMPDQWDGEILVPFSPESALSGVQRQLLPGQTLWYRREITIAQPASGSRLLLHFGAVDQYCRVWCNRTLLGEHSGGYWPFTFDITDSVRDGKATIMLAVTDDSDQGDEAWGKQTIARGDIWYTGQSGIWQTVWCEEVPAQYIENISITPLYRQGAVKIVTEGGTAGGTVRVLSNGQTVAQGLIKNREALITIPDFISWHPDHPHLYDLEICVGEDRVHSYFGMREFGSVKGSDGITRPTLNGKPYFYNGLLDQGYWSDGMYTPPSDEAMVWDITQIKKLGFNMLRKHIKVEPLRWYYHCDRLGVIVWQDFVSGGGPYKDWVIRKSPWLGIGYHDGSAHYALHGRRSKKGRRIFVRDARRTVKLLYNAVCIGVWVPFNEGWGQFDAARMCQTVHTLDQTRLIDHASGYFDQGAGDFHSYHIYYKNFRPDKRKRLDRILALTEFGGYSLPSPGHMASDRLMGYKVFHNEKTLMAALQKLYAKDVFPNMKNGLSVLIYTQVSDIEDEINGLFTYDRRVIKVNIPMIKAMNKRLYEEFKNCCPIPMFWHHPETPK